MAAVRVVVVGCGGMAGTWIKIGMAAENIEIVGLVDVHRPAAEKRAQEFGLPPSAVFNTLREAVQATKPDAVFDVTIPAAHDKVTIEALSLGCHVLGEKPMSDDLAKARAMVAKAREADRLYAVTQTRRPHGGALGAQKALQQGVIGGVQEVHCDFYIGARFGGFRAEMDYPLILDMAIHTFDNARQLTGADPVSVYTHSWNPKRSWYKGDASACCIFEMKLPDGSPVVYTYRGSWTNEGLQTDWNADWRVVGQNGTLRWDGGSGLKAQVVADEKDPEFFRKLADVEVPLAQTQYGGHEFLIREFADCVEAGTGFQRGRQPTCPCDDNIASVAMVLAAVESAKSGQRVPVRW